VEIFIELLLCVDKQKARKCWVLVTRGETSIHSFAPAKSSLSPDHWSASSCKWCWSPLWQHLPYSPSRNTEDSKDTLTTMDAAPPTSYLVAARAIVRDELW